MIPSYRPSDAELVIEARRALQRRITLTGPGDDSADPVASTVAALGRTTPALFDDDRLGPAPERFRKPPFGTPAYALALRIGWISAEEERTDRARYEARRLRSLRSSWRPSLRERRRHKPPRDTGAFVPALAARLYDDQNLSDGARRCGAKIVEITYRKGDRQDRSVEVTVTYLMEALGKCRRTVQRYLRQLEAEDYVRIDVVRASRTRMCCGLIVRLLMPLFPRHHKDKWPENRRNPGATELSLNYFMKDSKGGNGRLVPRRIWALWCKDGVFRSYKATWPPFQALPAPAS